MNRIVLLFFTLIIGCLETFCQNVMPLLTDSLVVEPVSGSLSYPIMNPVVSEYADKIMRLDYQYVLDDIQSRREKAKRRRKELPELDGDEKECRKALQMLKATDRVLVVDSVVVDKDCFLSGYSFGPEVGTIELADDGITTSFVTERGNFSYRSEYVKNDSSEVLRLVSSYLENGEYLDTRLLKGIEVDGDLNYPFMLADGVTFYFAARSCEGLGNYDLYATRYDSDSGVFYRPENMGFPFNSYANDYMLVIDETCNVGWFASDRYQPEGKVCIYTFIPNESRNPYDYENTESAVVRAAAMLCPISSTWNEGNEQERIFARQRLSLMQNSIENEDLHRDFTLVINDLYTYTSFADFRSEEARSLCKEWIELKVKLQAISEDLENKRMEYHSANKERRQNMHQSLLELEEVYNEMVLNVNSTEKKIRNTEISFLGM